MKDFSQQGLIIENTLWKDNPSKGVRHLGGDDDLAISGVSRPDSQHEKFDLASFVLRVWAGMLSHTLHISTAHESSMILPFPMSTNI